MQPHSHHGDGSGGGTDVALRAVSDVDGALRHLALWFPVEAVRRPGYRAAYAELFTSLPPSVRLTVLVHPDAAADLDTLVAVADRDATTTTVHTTADLRFTVWARDPAVPLRGRADQITFLAPERFNQQQDIHAVDQLARGIGARVHRSAACPPGGDLLVGDGFVLAGQDAPRAVGGDGGPASPGSTADRLRALLDPERKVLVLGSDRPLPEPRTRERRAGTREVLEILPGGPASRHPLRHLDTFVTLAGRGDDGRPRVLVGSPAVADQLLARPAVEPALDERFDEVAAQLVSHGFEVIRNPLPLTYAHGRRRIDGLLREVRLWYPATANNALVQVDAVEGDQVWLPTYGHGPWEELAATDAANRELWERLGFRVHGLGSYHAFAQRFGALRCLTQVLERGPR